MKRKQFFAMLLCVVMAVSLLACKQNPSAERQESSKESGKRTEADEPDAPKKETEPAQSKTDTGTVTEDEPEEKGSQETESVFSGDPVSAKVAVSSKNEKSLDVINTLEAGTDSYVYAQANVHGQMQTPMAIARRAINGKEVTSLEVRKLIRLLEIAQAKSIIQRDDKKLLKKLQRQVRSFEMKQNFQKLLGEGVALSPHVRR